MTSNGKSQLIGLIILLLFPYFGLKAQNLLVNPGAEGGAPATNGWKVVKSGSDCFGSGDWRIKGNQNGFPAAHSGTYYFYPGCGGKAKGETYELYQNVDVSAKAANIDQQLYGVTFSGYTQSYNQSPSEGATIIIEARNGANNHVIGSYSIGQTHNINGWVYYTASALLPSGTRFIRVRLIGNSYNGTSIDSYFDDLSLIDFSVLPVSLIQFNAVKNRDKVLLSWQTTNELNNNGFTIMRSSDQSNWKDLDFTASNYQSTLDNNYTFEDQNPLNGTNFYKLRQTDIDGAIKYSDIRMVVVNGVSSLQIYPNPAHDILNIQISNTPVSLEIIDISGKSIARYGHVKKIDISSLASGIYILKVATLDRVMTTKFVKR